NRFGLYFQDEWHATKTFMAVAGLRWDIQTMTGKPGINPTYSPRVALLYKPIEDHTFRLAGSVAYRPPNVIDTHLLEFASVPPTPFTPIFVQVGRKDLKPEKIVSYEAGYQGWYF